MQLSPRAALVWLALAAIALAVCGCGQPAPNQQALLTAAILVLSQDSGGEIPVGAIHDVQAILAGQPVVPSPTTPDNQVISPVTGEPCKFVNRDGLTALGILAVQAIAGVVQQAAAVEAPSQ